MSQNAKRGTVSHNKRISKLTRNKGRRGWKNGPLQHCTKNILYQKIIIGVKLYNTLVPKFNNLAQYYLKNLLDACWLVMEN